MEIYKKGSKGEVVRQIQRALAGAGLGVAVDGIYGQNTEAVIREFQRLHGLTPDGMVGPATLAKLLPMRFRKSKREIKYIVIHCTATRGWQDFIADDIRRMHKQQGWADIGYHYVVRLDGSVENGRDVDIIGAHVKGHNIHSIGIVYVGGLDNNGKAKDTRTENQKNAILLLLMDLRKSYPRAVICGHRDLSPDKNGDGTITPDEYIKECPCYNARQEYSRL